MTPSAPLLQDRRRKWAIALLAAQLLSAFATWLAAEIKLETIVVGGPLLAIVGFAVGMISAAMNSWTMLLFGLSAPAVSALGAFVIAIFRLGPREAAGPILMILSIYLLLIVPWAIVVMARIRQRPSHLFIQPPPVWRYSLKSLLGVMTAVAILTAVFTSIIKAAYDFPLVFSLYGSMNVAVSVVIAWRFYAKRRGTRPFPSQPMNSLPAWLQRALASVWEDPYRAAECSFCGRSHAESGPFAEGRDGSLICGRCAESCGKMIADGSAHATRERAKKAPGDARG